jgi:short-subunit dehydrogenase/FAD/FMN-containing dehydrogenase
MTGAWRCDYVSWGRTVRSRHFVIRPSDMAGAAAAVAAADARPMLGYGCGRSYGDVPLNPGGRLIDCRGLDRFIAFDPDTGVLSCEAGVRLADILAVVCRSGPDGGGWFLPVTPGSRFVTVGGAIANDVHGKNHHRFGTFGRHVLCFTLARSDGTQLTCSPQQHADMFAATIGGLGLTGLILRATLQLRRVAGHAVESQDIRFASIGDFFDLAAASDDAWEYTAAWVDCRASGASLGRGIFSRARHAAGQPALPPSRAPRLRVPIVPPLSLANPLTVAVFNALHWRKAGFAGTQTQRYGSYAPVLYPLDAIGDWNRIYGPRGFFQLQIVVPPASARDGLAAMLRAIAASGQASMLSVLKLFGDQPSPGLMSFPMPGATLALDFPNTGAATRELLTRLGDIAAEAGGRIYPAKDSSMGASLLRRGYPQLDRFLSFVDPGFSSGFARRLALLPGAAIEASSMPPDPAASQVVAIFGATSDIAMAVARRYAEAGWRLVLIGRNTAALADAAADLATRGAGAVAVQPADFARLSDLPAVAQAAWERFGGLDVALVAYGTLPDQRAAEQDAAAAEAALQTNFSSPVLLLTALASRFAAAGRRGSIAAITSVAGDRGRQSNALYGAAKGGLQRYLEGLRHRLAAQGVSVLDIRPGFVASKMTAHLDRSGPLWASPERVAADIVRAIAGHRAVLYTPWFWRVVMTIIRNLPRAIFHRTSL